MHPFQFTIFNKSNRGSAWASACTCSVLVFKLAEYVHDVIFEVLDKKTRQSTLYIVSLTRNEKEIYGLQALFSGSKSFYDLEVLLLTVKFP